MGVLGAAIVLLRLVHGVGVGGDAKYYIELARALAEGGRGLEWLSGQATELVGVNTRFELHVSALWPPLYSIMLALSGGFAFDARSVAGPVNAAAFGLTVFVAGLWLREAVRSRLLIVLGCALIAFSVTVTYWASWALSEAVFIPLTVLALLSIHRFLKSGGWPTLILAAVFSALACLTRYSGVFLVLVVVPLLALRPDPALSGKLRRIGVYLMVSIGPLALWLLRNYLVTETLTGPRGGAAGGPLVKHIGRGLNSIEAWNPLAADVRALALPLDRTPEWIIGGVMTGVALLALAALVGWWGLRWWRDEAQRRDSRHAAIVVAGVYAFGHMAFSIASASLGSLTLTSRQLAPMYVPMVVVAIVMADSLLSTCHRMSPLHRRAAQALIAGLVVCAVYAAYVSARDTHTAVFNPEYGWNAHGYNEEHIRMSPLHRRAAQALIAGLVVCAVYAAYVSARDTHTAVFNPEYGWNAHGYNEEHIDIETTSAKDYLYGLVGDSGPVVRAPFDLYLGDGTLIYFKEDCTQEDFERKVLLYVQPVSNFALPGIHKSVGTDLLDFFPARQGVRVEGECLAIAPLPEYDIKLITTGQYVRDTVFWEVDLAPAERAE